MTGDQERSATAESILDIRFLRMTLFPSELFDEFAWNMLLILFVGLANNEVISEERLVDRAQVSVAPGRRWITHLMKDGHIAGRQDGDDVILTPRAVLQLRKFLDEARALSDQNISQAT